MENFVYPQRMEDRNSEVFENVVMCITMHWISYHPFSNQAMLIERIILNSLTLIIERTSYDALNYDYWHFYYREFFIVETSESTREIYIAIRNYRSTNALRNMLITFYCFADYQRFIIALKRRTNLKVWGIMQRYLKQ